MPDKFRTFPRITPLTKGDFVGRQLLSRKKRFGKTAVPRAVWVRAISNAVELDESGREKTGFVGNLNVLVGGLLSKRFNTRGSFETLYRRPGRQIQDKPIPGIDSINVTSKGEYQSLRVVTINWTCPNLEDLDELAPYWLSPGVSIWVEWGWGQVGSRPVSVDVDNVVKLKQYYEDAGKIYDEVITASNGNQDGYMGVITGFSFTQNDDGSWSCVTTLTSMGRTLIPLDLNKDKVVKGASTKAGKQGNVKKTETIKGFVEDTFNDSELSSLPIPSFTPPVLDERTGQALSGTWKGTRDVLYITEDGVFSDTGWIFVSWRFIEQEIVNKHTAFEFDGQGGKGTLCKMNSYNIQISNDPGLYTTNGDVALVVHEPGNGAFSFDVPGNQQAGYMTHLYFNHELVRETFLEAETLEEALMKLLRQASNACGDLWNFQLQPNPMAENTLQVIDMNFVSEIDLRETQTSFNDISTSDNKILSFGGYSGDSILASVSFTSKLTDQLAMKYTFGRNKSNESKELVVNDDNDAGVTTIFGTFTDRILYPLDPPPSPPDSENPDAKKARQEREQEEQEERERFSISLIKYKEALATGKRPEFAESGFPSNIIILEEEAKEFLVEYLNRDLNVNSQGKIIENRIRHKPLYPIEISVTIDGISGILPGNCFTLDNVPRIYKEKGVFQVVEVGHDVGADDWTTTLRCFYRYISDEKERFSFYSPEDREKEFETSEGV